MPLPGESPHPEIKPSYQVCLLHCRVYFTTSTTCKAPTGCCFLQNPFFKALLYPQITSISHLLYFSNILYIFIDCTPHCFIDLNWTELKWCLVTPLELRVLILDICQYIVFSTLLQNIENDFNVYLFNKWINKRLENKLFEVEDLLRK